MKNSIIRQTLLLLEKHQLTVKKIYLMKKSEAQLNILTNKSRKVSSRKTTISYAHCQNFSASPMAEDFGMRFRRSIWYAQGQITFLCAGAGQIFMRTRSFIFFFYAQGIFLGPCFSSFICNTF